MLKIKRLRAYSALRKRVFRRKGEMIDIKQLRIGGIVAVNNPQQWAELKDVPMRITGITPNLGLDREWTYAIGLERVVRDDNIFRNTYSQFIQFIEPIPLTEELLLKCGFEKSGTKAQEKKYFSNNEAAQKAFKKRVIDGLNLSDRVWRYTDQFKAEIELGIDIGLRDGKSAAQMARSLKQYLQDPEKLFRRVRDEHGNLRLSESAKAYHPGQGVYRSSYKNALRTARTEINTAYHSSDHQRWQQFSFVIGQEVMRSNNPYSCDVCESLKGKYPKA